MSLITLWSRGYRAEKKREKEEKKERKRYIKGCSAGPALLYIKSGGCLSSFSFPVAIPLRLSYGTGLAGPIDEPTRAICIFSLPIFAVRDLSWIDWILPTPFCLVCIDHEWSGIPYHPASCHCHDDIYITRAVAGLLKFLFFFLSSFYFIQEKEERRRRRLFVVVNYCGV